MLIFSGVFERGLRMKVPEAKEYLAVLVDSAGRVLLRSEPGPIGGYFIRAEPSGNKTPEGSIIDSVFEECGLMVRVVAVGVGVYFGGSGTCGYFIVELIDSGEIIRSDGFFVNWYGIEDARRLISNLKNDADYELEVAVLGVAASIVEESAVLMDDRLKALVGTAELESFKRLCCLVERALSFGENMGLGLGIHSTFIMEMIAQVEHGIASKVIDSEYVESLVSKSGKEGGSRVHESSLVELVSVSVTEAYSCLIRGDLVGYEESHQRALGYLKKHCELYPEESRAKRERGFKGGRGKAEKRKGRDDIVRKIIIDTLQKNAPYRVARKPRLIAEIVVDEVLAGLREQGVECKRGDMYSLILDMLIKDDAAKRVIGAL